MSPSPVRRQAASVMADNAIYVKWGPMGKGAAGARDHGGLT